MYEVVRYNNGLNTVPLRRFTAVEMDLFWSICSKMKRQGTQTLEFDFEVFKELSNYSSREKERFYNDLKDMFDKMSNLKFYYEDERYYEQLTLFQRFTIDKEKEAVIIQASERFEFILNSIGSNFTRFDLENMTELDSGYVKELYRNLMQYRDYDTRAGYWAVTVEDFRERLAIPDSYRMSDIDKRIFNKAKKELVKPKGIKILFSKNFQSKKSKQKKEIKFTVLLSVLKSIKIRMQYQ